MKIRALTFFCNVNFPFDASALDSAAHFLKAATDAFAAAGIEVQTTRLATQPLETWPLERDKLAATARAVEDVCRARTIEYVSLGPIAHRLDLTPVVPDIIAATEQTFLSIAITRERTIDFRAIVASAAAIKTIANTHHGFGNLRFAAIANCPAGIPYFPVAYHDGGPSAFGLALQAADLAVEAFSKPGSLEQARASLVTALESYDGELYQLASQLGAEHGIRFLGIDWSLAPFPEPSTSIGRAIEELGVGRFGAPGTLFAAAFLTDCLRRARIHRTGYSGLMLPVLEDAAIARAVNLPGFSTANLLLYSAVCGLGLDTVPLAGDIGEDEIAGIILDLATLAIHLDKSLTARLMPIPNVRPGEPVRFDFPYFAAGRTFPSIGYGVGRLFERADSLEISPRFHHH